MGLSYEDVYGDAWSDGPAVRLSDEAQEYARTVARAAGIPVGGIAYHHEAPLPRGTFHGRNVDPQRGGLLIHHTAQVAPTYGHEEQTTMSPFESDPRSELEKQREALESQLARTLAKINALERLPDLDATESGAVILWTRAYPGAEPTTYTYVAVKQDGRWFTTSSRSGDAVLTSRELAEKHLIRASEVWVASGWVVPTPAEPIDVPSEA